MSYIIAPRDVRVTPAWKRQTPKQHNPVIVKDINGNILRVEDVKHEKRKAKVAKRKATNRNHKKRSRVKVAKVATAKVSRVEALAPRLDRAELDREFMRRLGSVHLDDN